jgi:nitroreductase
MDTIQTIRARRSVHKFLDKKIPDEVLYAILEAGHCAPAAGNYTNWRFLVIENEEQRKLIGKAAMKQDWVARAPIIVIVCSDTIAIAKAFGERAKKFYSIQNVAAATENMLLAATNFGIGSCWVGAFAETPLRKEFQIPDDIEIHAIIPLGYPAERPAMPSKPYFADVCWWGEWFGLKRAAEIFPLQTETIPRVKKELERHLSRATKEVSKAITHIQKHTKKKR